MSNQFGLSERVKTIFRAENIGEAEGLEMLNRSAPYTQREGANRRFHQWWFLVEGGVCQQAGLIDLVEVTPVRPGGFMEEDCTVCHGEGCHACGWNGVVRRYL